MDKLFKAIIIDDEPLSRNITKQFLLEYSFINVVAECSDGFEGIKKINQLQPDIVFLDIQMPKLNGFEMLELLDSLPVIIFITAYDQYAIKAFEVNAADYLLKPFSKERFDEAINKAKTFLQKNTSQSELIKKLISHSGKTFDDQFLERVVIKKENKIIILPVSSIKWIEAQDDYVMIYSTEGKFLKQKTMKYFENNLNPKNFIRIHRSYIVAVDQLESIELIQKNSYQVITHDKTLLPVSKSGYEKLKELIK